MGINREYFNNNNSSFNKRNLSSNTNPVTRQNNIENKININRNNHNLTKNNNQKMKPRNSSISNSFLESEDDNDINDTSSSFGKAKFESMISLSLERKMNKYFVFFGIGFFAFLLFFFLLFSKNADSLAYSDGFGAEYNKDYEKFYTKIEDVQESYLKKYGVIIDKELIIATLVAVQDNNIYADSNDSEIMVDGTTVDANGNVADLSVITTDMANKIELLAKYQLVTNKQCSMDSSNYRKIASNDDGNTGNNFWKDAVKKEKNYKCVDSNVPTTYEISIDKGNIDNVNSGSSYYWNLIDEDFIVEYFNINIDKNINYELYMERVSHIVDEIYSYYSYIKKDNTNNEYLTCERFAANCPGIKIVDDYGNSIKSLDEYVLGVLLAEGAEKAWDLLSYNQEALLNVYKSYALSIRTYTLQGTNNCDDIVYENTLKHDYVDPNLMVNKDYYKLAYQAVYDTSGQMLIYNNTYVNVDTSIYQKENQVITAGSILYYASEGNYEYQKLLSNIYVNDVKVGSGSVCVTNAWEKYLGYPSVHENVQSLMASSFYEKGQNGLLGQCPWYAKSRVIEILTYSNISELERNVKIKSIKNTYGNGQDWYKNPDGTIFSKSTNYLEPKKGSIVVWKHGKYGHVGIIEQVYDDGTVLLSEGWRARNEHGQWDYSTGWEDVRYQSTIRTLDYIKQHDSYEFVGYVYILE